MFLLIDAKVPVLINEFAVPLSRRLANFLRVDKTYSSNELLTHFMQKTTLFEYLDTVMISNID